MNYVTIAIIVIVVSLLMRYLVAASKKQPLVSPQGTMVLKMNKVYGIIGYVGIGFSAVIGVIASIGTVKSTEDLYIVIGLVLFFLALSIPLVLVARNLKVEVDDPKLKYFSVMGKIKELEWGEIRQVKFSKAMMELSLISESTKVKIHLHLVGFPSFIDVMKQKIDYSLYKEALGAMESVLGKFNGI